MVVLNEHRFMSMGAYVTLVNTFAMLCDHIPDAIRIQHLIGVGQHQPTSHHLHPPSPPTTPTGTVDGSMKIWKTPPVRTWEIEPPIETENPRLHMVHDSECMVTNVKAVRISDFMFAIVGRDGAVLLYKTPTADEKELGEPILMPPPLNLSWVPDEEDSFPVVSDRVG